MTNINIKELKHTTTKSLSKNNKWKQIIDFTKLQKNGININDLLKRLS